MKTQKLVALATTGFAMLACAPAFAGPDVNVSIGINQPGVYGRINIGSYPQPALVYPQPVVIVQQPVAVQPQPVYLYVPTAQQRDWRRYCGRYSACGQPVYFVQERWVRERYAEEQHKHDNGLHRGQDKREDRQDDDRDRGDKHDKGDKGDKGKGHGRGH